MWTKGLDLKHDIVALLAENIGRSLLDTGIDKGFWKGPQRLRQSKQKQMGLYQSRELPHCEGNCQQREQAAYKM